MKKLLLLLLCIIILFIVSNCDAFIKNIFGGKEENTTVDTIQKQTKDNHMKLGVIESIKIIFG